VIAISGVETTGGTADVINLTIDNAASLMSDPLLGTVFQTTFTKSVTPVYLNVILKLNYSIEHIIASFVSAPGRFINSAL